MPSNTPNKTPKLPLIPVRLTRSDGITQTYYLSPLDPRARAALDAAAADAGGKPGEREDQPGPIGAGRADELDPQGRGEGAPVAGKGTGVRRKGDGVGNIAGVPAKRIRTIPRGGFRRKRGASYSTWFKAMGTVGLLADMRDADSPDLLGDELPDFPAPRAFYSQQSDLLGKVKWQGVKPLGELIGELNNALQFVGEEVDGFDFRTVYDQWEFRYQIAENVGGPEGVTTIIIDEIRGRPRFR